GWPTRDNPAPATLHRLFEQQAERTPDAVALVYAAQQLSYRELNRQAEQLARQLVQLGVAGDAPVGICAERSIELVVAMLGVLKAGGAYLPLDPDYPQERLAAMMADADVRLILVQPRFIDSFDSFPSSAWERSPGSSGFPLSVVQLPKKLADAPAHHALQASASRTHTGSRSFPGRVPNLEVGNQPDQPDPQELAYVLFTSGSTGRPKGVGIPHGGVCNRLLWMQQRYALDDSDVVLQKTPYTFDVSVWEFFWPLLTGARLALLAPGAHREPERLAAAIKQYGVTTLHFVPSMLNAFLEAGAMAGCRTLRRVICSGEALSADLQARFFAHSDAELHNLYGPTEASIDVTAWACRRDLPATPVPIGHPIANTRIYLLDARLNPVPVGVPGELYIGGVQLARGYLNRPELTAERFVPNPFLRLEAGGRRLEAGDGKPGAGIETGGLTGDLRLKEAESNAGCQPQASDLPPYASRLRPPVSSLPPQTSRLYRSGDLARYRADGSIEYLGRLDHQVKIRGFRIELGEIEARLRLHPAVRQATVIAREDHPGDKRLVAYVVATGRTGFPPRPQRLDAPSAASESTSATEPTNVRDGVQTPSRPAGDPAPSAETLRAWLAAALPDYMIPAAFVTLENLPVTPNGKLDRKALPVPDIGGQFEHRYVAPGNALEARLSMLWAEVLRLERVGIHDNFFALGGDSILSIQVASRAHQAGHQLTPRAIFQHQTIAELAAFMAGDPAACRAAPSEPVSVAPFVLANLPAAELAALVAAGVEDAYPLSSMQEGMLFHTLASPASGIYVMQDRYEIRGPVDVAAFRQAWQAVLERHPVLRTAFVWDVAARPHQIVYRRLAPPCEYLDWSDADAAEQERRLASLLRTEQVRGFDLARAPLFHIRLIKRGDGRFLCVRSYHHILMDEWCTSPMLLEFRENYAALSQGRGCPERPLQPFRAYIAWIESRDAAKTESFWRRYLQGFTEPTALVGERTRNDYGSLSLRERAGVRELNSPDPSVADLSLELSAEDTAALHALSLRHRLTVNTFVQGALAFLLSRYSAQTDVVFGVTVSGRPSSLPGVETMLGLFINALPLRVQVQAQQPLLEWLQTLLARNLDLRQYEYASLVQIQSWSAIPRSEAELFQHLLTFENAPIDPSLLTEKDVLDMAFVHNRVHTNYPITFVAIPGERLHLRITYQLARFEAAVVQRMLEHFKRVLECMIRSPDRRVGQLSLLGEQECRVMQDWNRTGHAYNAAADFVARFAAQVERTPDAAAVACQGESLSYRALNARANRLAHGLIAQGVGPDGIVALLSDRGIGFAVAMLGVFKAGGAYLPLDPAQPDGRLAQVLLESRVGWVLAGANHLQRAQTLAGSPTVLSLESLAADTPRTDEPPRRHRADNLAFVIFTSGSTGTPKGAMVEHRGMFNNLITKVPTLALTEADVIAQTAGQCFDISVWQYLTALVCGARVEVFPDEIVKEPGRLLAGLAERGVTILEAVPSMIQALLEMVAECVPTQSVGTIRLPQLRWLLACGEAFAPELCRRWMARFPRVQVLNAYGPAECSDDVSYYRVPAIPGEADALVPIGYPVHNTRLYLLDPWLAPVPVGIPGEICVAGIQVGRGYLYRPDLTAARFLPDPHGAAGTRLYRTGDLGRYREDGCIEFLGRIDHQVKIRGFRIELGEIEAQLLALSPVEQAIVVVREDARCGKQLVAYLVCGPAATAPASDLIDALRRQLSVRLPDYMVPAAFVLLDAMPLGATGKIDRKALPAPDIAAQRQERYVAPR
ncbi:MAG: amino acid adenylation domain-containing protein, partial [Methylococcaceae bacterium]